MLFSAQGEQCLETPLGPTPAFPACPWAGVRGTNALPPFPPAGARGALSGAPVGLQESDLKPAPSQYCSISRSLLQSCSINEFIRKIILVPNWSHSWGTLPPHCHSCHLKGNGHPMVHRHKETTLTTRAEQPSLLEHRSPTQWARSPWSTSDRTLNSIQL